MPISRKLLAQFEESGYYHVICKSINDRKLFLNDDNRIFFLQRYNNFLSPFIKTYTYCMLSNHVHFLIQPKCIRSINQFLKECPPKLITTTHKKFMLSDQIKTFHELIEQQFNRLFISYSLKFNKQQNQAGHLFLRPFKRKSVKDDFHLTQLMIYIHSNPFKHKIIKDFTSYKWSSYQAMLSDAPTQLCRNEVLDWFGGKENFIRIHKEQSLYYYDHPDSIE